MGKTQRTQRAVGEDGPGRAPTQIEEEMGEHDKVPDTQNKSIMEQAQRAEELEEEVRKLESKIKET